MPVHRQINHENLQWQYIKLHPQIERSIPNFSVGFTFYYLPLTGETSWFDLPLIQRMLNDCRGIFPQVAYAVGNTPTYAGGQMGYMLCSSDPVGLLLGEGY